MYPLRLLFSLSTPALLSDVLTVYPSYSPAGGPLDLQYSALMYCCPIDLYFLLCVLILLSMKKDFKMFVFPQSSSIRQGWENTLFQPANFDSDFSVNMFPRRQAQQPETSKDQVR